MPHNKRLRCVIFLLTSSPLLVSAGIISGDIGMLGNTVNEAIPSIMGASNLHQYTADTASAVTTLYSSRIRKLGLNKIEETVRLIPGIVVAKRKDHTAYIQYHLGNLPKSRTGLRLNGHNYITGVGRDYPWAILNFTDIKRITFARSPSGASFGDNAYSSQFDIQTFNAKDHQLHKIGSLQHTQGSRKTQVTTITAGADLADEVAISLIGTRIKSDGFDQKGYTEAQRLDYFDKQQANFKVDFKGENSTFTLYTGFTNALYGSTVESLKQDLPQNDDLDDPYNRGKTDILIDYTVITDNNSLFKLSADYQRYKFDQHWNNCDKVTFYVPSLVKLAELNQSAAKAVALGQNFDTRTLSEQALTYLNTYYETIDRLGEDINKEICYRVYEKVLEEKTSLSTSYELSLLTNIRTVFGANVYYEQFNSNIWFNGSFYNYGYSAFNQIEYKHKRYTVNFGISTESGRIFNDVALALRGSFNYHFDGHNTLRLAYSEGYRTPDIMETHRDWSYTNMEVIGWNPYGGESVSPFFKNLNPITLKPERIQSYEISYLANYDNMQVDIKLFIDQLKDLVTADINYLSTVSINQGSKTVTGAETKIELDLGDFDLGFIYAYMNHNTDNEPERRMAVNHVGSAYAIFDTGYNQSIALAYYGNSANTSNEQYGRTDFVYTRDWFLNSFTIILQGRFSHYLNDVFATGSDTLFNEPSYIKNKNEFYATVKLSY